MTNEHIYWNPSRCLISIMLGVLRKYSNNKRQFVVPVLVVIVVVVVSDSSSSSPIAKICQTSLRMCHIQCEKAKKQEIYYLLHFMHRIQNFIFHVPPSHVLYNNKLLIFSLKSERKREMLHQNKSLAKAAPLYINYTCMSVCEHVGDAIFHTENPLHQKETEQ